jgi:hypothetical protein
MDTWSSTCQSCGREYKVEASSEEEAIKAAEAKHDSVNAKATAFRCDLGPMMTSAVNLTNPAHPCAQKEW